MKVDDAFLDAFTAIGKDRFPPAKKLAMLLKPAFVADPGTRFTWGDWSNIEARVTPWLADSPGAEKKLDIFRLTDRDKNEPDMYVRTAAALTSQDVRELWARYRAGDEKAEATRQAYGKVPELSLTFGGALGALMAMAVNYGVYLDTKTATEVVQNWRNENGWARTFWGKHGREGSYGLWGAANSAIEHPDTIYPAGRVAFVYDRDYLNGTLFCGLPDGIKTLVYPNIKWEWREVEVDGKLVDRYQLTYQKAYGRAAAWYGKFAENVTQATAALVLKRTLKRLEHDPELSDLMPVVMHTHDEVVTEHYDVPCEAADILHKAMTTNDDWDQGLPLAAEITSNWYYTKGKF